MATGPVGPDPEAALQSERDALAQRCAAAEAECQRLAAELEQVRAELASVRVTGHQEPISLFEDEPAGTDRLTGDGSDPRVLSGVLAATAVVAAMVAVLTLVNGKIVSPFGVVVVVLTIALAWGAARTRIVPVEVSVVRGIVFVERGDSTYRFDLRKPETKVEMVGRPGDAGWSVRFLRRHLDPCVVDASMVDPHDFVRRLREHRPDL